MKLWDFSKKSSRGILKIKIKKVKQTSSFLVPVRVLSFKVPVTEVLKGLLQTPTSIKITHVGKKKLVAIKDITQLVKNLKCYLMIPVGLQKLVKDLNYQSIFLQSFLVGSAILFMSGVFFVANAPIPNTQVSQELVIKHIVTKQTSVIVAGRPITYTTLIARNSIKPNQYLAQLPKGATNIKITHITKEEAKQVISQTLLKPQKQLTLKDRQQLVKTTSQNIFTNLKRYLVASLQDVFSVNNYHLVKTASANFLNLSYQIPKKPATKSLVGVWFAHAETTQDAVDQGISSKNPNDQNPIPNETQNSSDQVTSSSDQTPIHAAPENTDVPASQEALESVSPSTSDSVAPSTNGTSLQQAPTTVDNQVQPQVDSTDTSIVGSSPSNIQIPAASSIIEEDTNQTYPFLSDVPNDLQVTTPIVSQDATAEQDQQALLDAQSSDLSQDPIIKIDYQVPAPVIKDITTDTGKLVTVSAENEDPLHPLTDVLAHINIPEIFKVGQEQKIKIKWHNNGNQDVQFKAYDLNNNGKLDYVEWTVPHLSEQTFDIIFVSRAFELDQNKEIINDVYDAVSFKDDNYATIANNHYVRATFDSPFDNKNSITLYAKSDFDSTIEVYPVYLDGSTSDQPVATFSTIKDQAFYKVSLKNLQTPTDTFDLKIVGDTNIDYIVYSDINYSPYKILTPAGYKNLSELQVGDDVVGYGDGGQIINKIESIQAETPDGFNHWEQDEEGNNTKYIEVPFTYYLINEKWELFKNQSLWANGNVMHAEELQVGDTIYDTNNQEIKITSIKTGVDHIQWIRFGVSGNHSYVADGLLLHNASRYWVGSGASVNWNATANTNWSATSNGSNNASVPGSSDDVFFDGVGGGASNSTLSAAITIRSLDMNGYTNTLTHNSAVTLSIGDGTAGPSNCSLSPCALRFGSLTYTLGSVTTSAISFISTSTTAQNIDFNSKTTGNVTFNGSGGSWKLTGTYNAGSTTTTTLTEGTLDVNGQTASIGAVSSSNSNTRTLTMGATLSFTVAGTGTAWNFGTTTNLTFNNNSSTITVSGAGATFDGGGKTFGTVQFTGSGTQIIKGANTFSTLTRTGTAAKTDGLQLNTDQTASSGLNLNGNSVTNRLLITSDTLGTARTITSNALISSITNADFRDITGAGTMSWDLSAITGKSGDAGGNSGITFTTAAAQTWSGTSGGNWSANAWTSRVPLPQDNATISSAFTASQTVTADMPRLGKSIDWTGATGSPTFLLDNSPSVNHTIYGSLTLISGMTFTLNSTLIFEGRGSFTLTSAGNAFGTAQNVTIQMIGGTLTLQDDFTMGNSTSGDFTLNNGTFDANNKNFTTGSFSSANSNTRTITMGSGTWTPKNRGLGVTSWDTSTTTGLTLNQNTSTIKITDTSNNATAFSGGGKTFNNIWFSRGASTASNTIAGSNTFADFKDDGSAAHSILFTNGTTTTVTTFTVSGTAGNEITINSTNTSTHALTKAGGGTISSDYLNIQHSVATPSNTWYAGANSTNNQATSSAGSGWIFTVPPTNISVAGTVYTDEGVTTMGSGRTVSVSVNGAAAATNATTAANGTYSISAVAVSAGDVLTLYLDGATEKAVTVTVTAATNMTSIDLYQNDLITRCDNSCSLSNANIDTANNNGDTDIDSIYTGTTTITTASGKSLYIPASNTFAPANPVTVAGNFTNNGTFTNGSSTLTLTGTGTQTFKTNSSSLYNLTINGSGGTYTPADATTVSNNLVITAGTLSMVGSAFTVTGTTSISGTISTATSATGTKTFTGAVTVASGGTFDMSNQNPVVVMSAGLTQSSSNLVNLGSSGSNTFVGDFAGSGSGGITFGGAMAILSGTTSNGYTGGVVTVTGTLTLTGNWAQANGSSLSLGSTTPFGGAGTFSASTATNTVNYTANGALTVKDPNGGTIHTYSNLTLSGTGAKTMTAITTTNDFTMSSSASTSGNVMTTIGGNLALSSTAAFTTGANLAVTGTTTIGDGTTMTMGAFTLTQTGAMTVGGGSTGTFTATNGTAINLVGSLTIASGATWTKMTSGNVTFKAGGAQTWTDNSSGQDLGVVIVAVNGALASTLTLGSSVKATTMTINSSQTLSLSSYTLSLIGTSTPFTVSGVFTPSTGTINYIPATSSTITVAGTTYYNVTFNSSSTTFNLGGALTTNSGGTLTITAGTLDDVSGQNYAISVGGNWSNAGTFTARSGTVTLTSTSSGATLTSGGSSFYALTQNGSGGTYTLQDALAVSNNLVMTAGTLQLAAQNLTVTGTSSITGTLNDNSATGTNIFVGAVTINSGGIWTETNNPGFTFRGGLTEDSSSGFTSGTGTYTFDTNAQTISGSQSFTITNLTNNVSSSTGLTFSGAQPTVTTLTQGSSAQLTFSGSMPTITTLTATASSNTVSYTSTAGAQTIKGTTYVNLTVDKSGQTGTLGGTTTVNGTLTLTQGVLDANNNTVNIAGSFSSSNSNTRTITMGSGTWTLSGTGTVWTTATATGLTLNGNTSTIKVTDTSNTANTFSGGGKTFNNIWFSRGASTASNTIVGSNTFADFKDDGSAAHSILFTNGTTTTVTTFTVSGTAGNLITINSDNTATHALTKSGGGTISSDYLSIQHSVASPATTWYAGANSTNNQATATAGSGWVFTAPPSVSGTVYTDEGTTTMGSGRTVSVSINGAAAVGNTTTASNGTYTVSGVTYSAGDVLTIYLDGATEKAVTVTVGTGNSLTSIDLYQNDLITRCDNSCSLSNANLDTANNNGDTDIDAIYTGTTTITTASGKSLFIPSSHTFAPANPVTVAGNFTTNGTFTNGSSTLTLTGTGTQTLKTNGSSLYNLTQNGSGGTYTLQGGLGVTNNLTITAGTLDTNSASNYGITVGATWSRSGTFTVNSSNFTLTGTSTFSDTMSFYNFIVNGTSQTVTLGAALTASNNLTITAGTLDVSAAGCSSASCAVSVGGTWSNSGTFTARTGTVTLTGTSTFSDTTSFYDFTISGSGITVTLGGNFTATDILTLTQGTFNASSSNVTVAAFSSSNSNTRTVTMGSGTWTVTGNAATIWNTSTTTGLTFTRGSAIVSNYSGSTGTRTITAGSLAEANVPSFNITAGSDTVALTTAFLNLDFSGFTGTLSNSTRTLYGSLTIASGMTLTAGSNVTTFGATSGTKTITSNGKTLDFPITFDGVSGTFQLADNLTVGSTRTVTLTNGTLDANNKNFSLGLFDGSNSNTRVLTMGSGTWILTGTGTVWTTATTTGLTLTANTSTIKVTDTSNTANTFSGGGKTFNNIWFSRGASTASNTIAGSNTFADFKDDGSAAHSILFTAGITTTVTTFTVSGSSGNVITINSTTTGTHTLSKSSGTVTRDYLNIQHSIATGGATWYAGANSTNNQATSTAGSGWIFNAPPTIGGTVYSDEGTTALASVSIAISINGAAAAGTATSNGSGVYSIPTLSIVAGDVLTLYIDGASAKAVTVTVASGSDQSNIDLYQNDLITRCDNSCSLSNANLDTANNNGDTDIDAIYTGTTTITTASGKSLFIPSSHTYAPANPVIVAGNFTTNGTFTNGSSTLTLTGTGTQTLKTNGSSLYNLTQNGSGGTYTLQDNTAISNVLTITAGTLDSSSRTITLSGTTGTPFSNSGTFTASTGTVSYTGNNGSGNTTVANVTYNNLTINNSSETFVLAANTTVGGTTTITAGTLDATSSNYNLTTGVWSNGGTFTPRSATLTLTNTGTFSDTTSLYNFIVNGSGKTVTLGAALTTTNNLTITAGTLDVSAAGCSAASCAVSVGANWSNAGTFTPRTGTVTLTSTSGSATLDPGGISFYNLTQNGSGGTYTLQGGLGVTNNLTITAGTLDTNSASNYGITVGATWSRSGTFTVNSSNFTLTGTSTFSDTMSFYNFIVNGTSQTVTLGAALTASNNLTITAGTLDVSAAGCSAVSCAVSVGANWSNSGTFTARTGTVTLISTSSGATLTSGGSSFYNLTQNGTSGTYTLQDALSVSNNFVNTAGTLQLAAQNLTVTGTSSISGTLNDNSATGTNIFVGAVTINSGGIWTETNNPGFTFRGGLTENSSSGFTSGTGIYTFDTNAQTVSGSQSFTITNLTNNVTTGAGLTFSGAQPTVTTLTQGSSAQLTFSGSLPTITTLTATVSTNTVSYTGSSQAIIATTYDSLTVNGSGVATVGSTTTVNATMTVSTATTNNSTLTVTTALSGASTLTQGSSSTLNIAGTSGITGLDASTNTNTVNYTGGAQTVKAVTYSTLGLSGSGAKTMTSVATINNNFNMSGSATATTVLTSIGGNVSITGTAVWTNGATNIVTGTLTIGSGAKLTMGNFALTITSTTSLTGTIDTATGNTGTRLFIGAVTINSGGIWDLSGQNPSATFRAGLTENSSSGFTSGLGTYTFDTNAQTISGSQSFTITNLTNNVTSSTGLTFSGAQPTVTTLTQGSSAQLTFSGSMPTITTLTATASSNTVSYTLTTGAQTVIGTTYANLTIDKSGQTATIGGDTTVSNILTITAGTVDSSSRTITLSGTTGTPFSNSGTFTASTGTVSYTGNNGSGNTTVANVTYNNLTVNNSSETYVLAAATTANGTTTITAGTLDATVSNYNLTTGVWSNSGTFTPRSATLTLTNTGTFSDTTSFYNLTVNGSGKTVTLGAALTTSNNLTITAGTLDVSASGCSSASCAVSVAGGWSNSGTFTARTGGVTLNGTSQAITGSTAFYKFTKSVTTADTLTFPASVTQTITNTLTLTGAAGQLLSLRSSSTPTQWNIDPQAARTISYLDVKDSNNTNATAITTAGFNITDSGHNTNWTFDVTPPTTTPSATNSAGNYTFGNWSQSNVSVTLSCSDAGVGCTTTYYCTDTTNTCTPSTTYSSAVTVTTTGTSYIRYYSVDSSSNTETTGSSTIKIDTTAPTVDAGSDQTKSTQFTQDATSSDATSGIATYSWTQRSGDGTLSFGSATSEDTTISSVRNDTFVIRLTATDNAGNSSYDEFTLTFDASIGATQQTGGGSGGTWVAAIPFLVFTPPAPPTITPDQVAQSVPKETPKAFKWDLLTTKPIGLFVSVPSDIVFFAQKFPSFNSFLQDVGINKLNPGKNIAKINVNLPGFTQTSLLNPDVAFQNIGALKGIPLAQLSVKASLKVPTDIVFIKTGNELIDLNINLSFDANGKAIQKIKTVVGKPYELFIKPAQSVKAIKGFVVLKQKTTAKNNFINQSGIFASIIDAYKYFQAALLPVVDSQDVQTAETVLLLEKFDYMATENGFYVAHINAPTVEGDYEIITVMDYQDSTLAPRQIRLITVVDPEGYVYTQLPEGKLRITGAVVTLYWLNPETKQYEVWPAEKYLQKNPVVTNDTGKYSFLTPEGTYYLHATAPKYKDYQSETFTITKGDIGIYLDLPLQKNSIWPDWITWNFWIIIVLIAVFGALVYIGYQVHTLIKKRS